MGHTGIRQHSAALFLIVGHRGCLSMARHCSRSLRGVWIASGVARIGMGPLAQARPSLEGLFA
jgi:hypothetical protein